MEKLILQQGEIFEQIKRNYTNYKKTPKDRLTKAYIETRYENLETLWKRFTNTHFEIVVLASGTEKAKFSYFNTDVYSTAEDEYCIYKAKLREDIEVRDCVSSVKSTSGTPISEVKLPQIQLPSFSGNYEEWQTFYDMFVSLIHSNQSLGAVQKLHYLKSCLTGEPEVLLRNLSVVEANYEEAWEKLKRRYNNKRYNSNEILKRLFSQKSITTESASAIKQLIDSTSSCMKSLKNLGIKADSWDVFIVYLVVSKLDYESRRQWEIEVGHSESDDLPNWDQLVKFLEMRFRTLEMLDGTKSNTRFTQDNITNQRSTKKSFHSIVDSEKTDSNEICAFCSSPHFIYQCKQFGGKSPEERSSFVQTKGLCFNCLSPNHNVRGCHQATCCRRCGRRHHTLLHFEKVHQPVATTSSSSDPETSPSSETTVVAHFAREEHQSEVLLATALVRAKSTNGYSQIMRGLIDPGSEASFVSENTVQSLGLKCIPMNGIVSGVGEGQSKIKSKVAFNLESLHNSKFCIRVNAFVLSSLTSLLPSSKTSINDWSDIQNITLADPNYDQPGKIDIILGVDVYSKIMLGGLLKHPTRSEPIAQNTKLGWILSGRVYEQVSSVPRVMNLHIKVCGEQPLKQLCETERRPNLRGKKLTKEIKLKKLFERTTVRNDEGRCNVRLPFKESDSEKSEKPTEDIQFRRCDLLEKRLQKNFKFRERVHKVSRIHRAKSYEDNYKQQRNL